MPSQLEEAALRFRSQLLRQERQAASEMVRAYAAAWQRVRAELARLQEQIDEARAAGLIPDTFTPRQPGGPVAPRTPGTHSPSWLYEQERLASLQRQVERELRQFAGQAGEIAEANQLRAVQAAQANSQALFEQAARAADEAQGLVELFDRLPTEAVQEFVGFASDGSPLRTLFDELGPQVSRGVQDALVTAVATGQGPRETARMVRKQFGMGLNRALTIARTEQVRAYREATRINYERNADLLDGWVWLSAADGRTCASCWAMHGTRHPVSERLDDHPNGRCVMVPWVKGTEGPGIKAGEELFRALPAEEQERVLGKAAHLAYQDGAVRLGDFTGQRRDRQWGTMRYARSLREVLGASEATRWVRQSLQRKLASDARPFVLQELAKLDVSVTVPGLLDQRVLPKLEYHFNEHGQDMGANTVEEYQKRFDAAMSRSYDEVFVTRQSTARPVLMWRVVDQETGEVVQFSQATGKVFSFYRVKDWQKYVTEVNPVRVVLLDGVWKVQP